MCAGYRFAHLGCEASAMCGLGPAIRHGTGYGEPENLVSLACRVASRFCRAGRSSSAIAGRGKLVLQLLLLRAAKHARAARCWHVVHGGVSRCRAGPGRRTLRQAAHGRRRMVGNRARAPGNRRRTRREQQGKNARCGAAALQPASGSPLPLPVYPHAGSAVKRVRLSTDRRYSGLAQTALSPTAEDRAFRPITASGRSTSI